MARDITPEEKMFASDMLPGARAAMAAIKDYHQATVDQLARIAPVSRMMVRQPQSKANAGAFNNGMPMTSSLGCGIWGGNIANENVHLKRYMQALYEPHLGQPADCGRSPSEQELFGEFYGAETL